MGSKRCPKGVRALGPREDKEGFVEELVPNSVLAQTYPVALGLQVNLQGLKSALQLVDVTLAALHRYRTGHFLGHGC